MPPKHERAIVLRACRVFAAVLLVCVASSQRPGSAQSAREGSGPELKAIRVVATAGGQTTVVIEGSGALPEPVTGVLDAPPRIYLDFKGVRPALEIAVSGSDSLVRRARVALRTVSPLASRVVLDLVTASPYRVDGSGREQGRLVVVLGALPSPAAAPPRASPKLADPYVAQVSALLGRLEAVRPVLASIDRQSALPAGDLSAAASELDAVARTLAAIKPPTARQTTHGLLLRACAMGARAARLRQDSLRTGDAASGWNAASAAAGALIMLDQASVLRNP